jgi:RimJ/RimL family protein N-acetyltransferase
LIPPANPLTPYWPLFGLRIVTPKLEIRLPDDGELASLVEEVVEGVHDPATMPFTTPWTDVPSPRRERESLQWWWQQRAGWTPERWNFAGAVFVDGRPVGVQDLVAENFAKLRTVVTGSWLGLRHQGRGIGKEMRAAILHLAFAGLGAVEAQSLAWHDNASSIRVSEALGYVVNGEQFKMRRDSADLARMFRLTRENWERLRRDDIELVGLEPCLEQFGAPG